MITLDKNLGFLKIIFTNIFLLAHKLTEIILAPQIDASVKARPQATDLWLKRTFSEISTYKEKNGKEAILPATHSFTLTGHDSTVPLRFLLQTGLNGHHRLLYPVETRCLILKT